MQDDDAAMINLIKNHQAYHSDYIKQPIIKCEVFKIIPIPFHMKDFFYSDKLQ